MRVSRTVRQWQITLGKGPQTVAFQWHPHSVVFKDKREKSLEKKVYSLLPRMTNAQNHRKHCQTVNSLMNNTAYVFHIKCVKLYICKTGQTFDEKHLADSKHQKVKQVRHHFSKAGYNIHLKDRGLSSSKMTGEKTTLNLICLKHSGHDMAVGIRWNEWKA